MWVAFTGAGISQASGIPTFQERPDLREALDLDVWRRKPTLVWEAVWEMYQATKNASPNPAHQALAETDIQIITQNIDGLHQKAGSRPERILELHGNLRRALCQACGSLATLKELEPALVPRCLCGGLYKPDVVLYQEPVYKWLEGFELVKQASLLLVVGSSLSVSPAAELPRIARQSGAQVFVINEQAEQEVPKLVRATLKRKGT